MAKKDNKETTKKKFEPETKADAPVVYDENEPETFSEFEYLSKQVEVLKETVDVLAGILISNNLTEKKIIEADYMDDNEVFKRLEKEDE